MLAAMLRQSTTGGSSGGVAGGGTKLSMGISRFSSSSVSSQANTSPSQRAPARVSKSDAGSSEGSDVPATDPDYIMRLVCDVRKFADALLQLKEVFNSKGNPPTIYLLFVELCCLVFNLTLLQLS